MASRGAVAKNGHVTEDEYQTVKKVYEAKVLLGKHGEHSLPDYSHTPNRIYIKENSDGSFREMRVYNEKRRLYLEIGYHGEYHLTGNRKQPILHYHKYDENLDRTSADYLPKEMYEKYKKYLEAYGL